MPHQVPEHDAGLIRHHWRIFLPCGLYIHGRMVKMAMEDLFAYGHISNSCRISVCEAVDNHTENGVLPGSRLFWSPFSHGWVYFLDLCRQVLDTLLVSKVFWGNEGYDLNDERDWVIIYRMVLNDFPVNVGEWARLIELANNPIPSEIQIVEDDGIIDIIRIEDDLFDI